ncbi:T9SS type A sorting domain-containing protein [bacterium]|nr:T9SS type A sorting domain-containing protein [bacterium]
MDLQTQHPHTVLAAAAALLLIAAGHAAAYTVVQITNDAHQNYMPSLVQLHDETLMIAYERLDTNFENGDILVTFSDDGSSWTTPALAVNTAGNERHPALVQLANGSFQLYYLSDEVGGYRIHMASSPDGHVWTREGTVALGWSTESLVNPTVCVEANGSLTMTYDVLSNGGYIAHSADAATWDQDRTNVSTGSLNRIMRHSDGTYVLSYQRKTGIWYYQIDIFTKTSSDRVSWSGENRVTYTQNSHDSFPLELADGSHGLFYATSTGGNPYDLFSRDSTDGASWGNELSWLTYSGWDTEPHPITLVDGRVALAWPKGPNQDNTEIHFVILDPSTSVAWPNGDEAPKSSGGNLCLAFSANPFADRLTIWCEDAAGDAEIRIYDVTGRRVGTLVTTALQDGAIWDGADDAGRSLPSGVYLMRAVTDAGAATGKIVLLR